MGNTNEFVAKLRRCGLTSHHSNERQTMIGMAALFAVAFIFQRMLIGAKSMLD